LGERLDGGHAWVWRGRMCGGGGGDDDGAPGEERWTDCDGRCCERRGRVSETGSENVSGGYREP